jgi:hypothetical protein
MMTFVLSMTKKRFEEKGRGAELKGQSHKKVYELLTWDGSFSLN